jgi:hypothetical protein
MFRFTQRAHGLFESHVMCDRRQYKQAARTQLARKGQLLSCAYHGLLFFSLRLPSRPLSLTLTVND